jgi:hypothetical protein
VAGGNGFENMFDFLIKQCEETIKGFEEAGAMRPFALPEPEEDYTEESMLSLFDRKEFEDKYEEAVNSDETKNMHKDMMVPTLKNDIVAGVHRDVFLRHTNRIRRFIAEAHRRKNHSVNVHPKRKAAMELFESLKARED